MGESSKQGGEAADRKWDWVEAEVWTGRRLTALQEGVKGGKWFSLISAGQKHSLSDVGYIPMAEAHAQICQSRCGHH